MSHISRMMNMRLKGMQTTLDYFWKLQNELMEWEQSRQINETSARCESLTEFCMFRIDQIFASDYQPLPGY